MMTPASRPAHTETLVQWSHLMSRMFVRLGMHTTLSSSGSGESRSSVSRTDAGAETLVEGVASHCALTTRSHAAEGCSKGVTALLVACLTCDECLAAPAHANKLQPTACPWI
jgi:hypothetical protein